MFCSSGVPLWMRRVGRSCVMFCLAQRQHPAPASSLLCCWHCRLGGLSHFSGLWVRNICLYVA